MGLCYRVAVASGFACALMVAGAGQAFAAVPGWNGMIAFNSDRSGNSEIYIMKSDGTGVRQLTDNAASDSSPAWSPDGSRIAFTSDRSGNQEIHVMKGDGSGQTRLTYNPSEPDYAAAWSPDGSKISFTSGPAIDQDVYVMNADGSGRTNLTPTVARYDGRADWSPDGSKITFYIHCNGTADLGCEDWAGDYYPELWVMNPDGSGQAHLQDLATESDWAPDGSKISIDDYWDGYYISSGDWDVATIDPQGGNRTVLTETTAYDGHQSWSPDGAEIAFYSNRDGNGEVYVMNSDGDNETNLTNHPARDDNPDWQPLQLGTNSDADEWVDLLEAYVGTDAYDACAEPDVDPDPPTEFHAPSPHPYTPGDNAWPPDVNNDGTVNIRDDIIEVARAFGTPVTNPRYRLRYDMNADGAVSIGPDILKVASFFGDCPN